MELRRSGRGTAAMGRRSSCKLSIVAGQLDLGSSRTPQCTTPPPSPALSASDPSVPSRPDVAPHLPLATFPKDSAQEHITSLGEALFLLHPQSPPAALSALSALSGHLAPLLLLLLLPLQTSHDCRRLYLPTKPPPDLAPLSHRLDTPAPSTQDGSPTRWLLLPGRLPVGPLH